MKSLRLVTLLLLPLLAPTFMAEQPSSVSYAQAGGPVRFPSAVAPRNDIQMQNRVPVRIPPRPCCRPTSAGAAASR